MLKNNNYKIEQIIRVCRTWPSENFSGVGLHAYYYTKYINVLEEVNIIIILNSSKRDCNDDGLYLPKNLNKKIMPIIIKIG